MKNQRYSRRMNLGWSDWGVVCLCDIAPGSLYARPYIYAILVRIWRWYKAILRLYYGHGEIERLCVPESARDKYVYWRLDSSMRRSRLIWPRYQQALRGMQINHRDPNPALDLVNAIDQIKQINPYSQASIILHVGIVRILAREQEVLSVQKECSVPVTLEQHEPILRSIWEGMFGKQLEKESKSVDWVSLGFQGSNPCTDFRSVGFLALDHLHYFVSTKPASARKMLDQSRTTDPNAVADGLKGFYPFALAGIHITSTILGMLRAGMLQRWVHSQSLYITVPDSLRGLYILLFQEFNDFWLSQCAKNPSITVLQFEPVYEQFVRGIRHQVESCQLGVKVNDKKIK